MDLDRTLDELITITDPSNQQRYRLERMVESIADQLCHIVSDNYDFRISVDCEASDIQIQKLSSLINFLLENVRRNIGSLKEFTCHLESIIAERTLRLDLVASGSNDGVWIWNVKGGEVEFSPRWREMIGASESLLGNSMDGWLNLVHPQDRTRLRMELRKLMQGLDPHLRVDYRIRHSNGRYRSNAYGKP